MNRAGRLRVLGFAAIGAALAGTLIEAGMPGDSPSAASPDGVELVPGARGTARTVLQGDTVEEIPLTYLGTYQDFAGPGYDLHVVQLEGPVAERLGVALGMSGSPVYIEGRLIGALAYRLGSMPKEAVAGVTPIENMLIASVPRPSAPPREDSNVKPIATPILAAGMFPEVRRWLAPQLGEMGLVLVAGGEGRSGAPAAVLVPGSMMGAVLLRGDLKIAALGTVTWVDGDRVYAFGHPFFGGGRVDMPMVAAQVMHTLPDLTGSFKLANIGTELGAIVEDRFTAVVGRSGLRSRMIPMEIDVRGGDFGSQRFQFELVDSSSLSPLLAATALANSLQTHVGHSAESTMVARGLVHLRGLPDMPVEMAFAGGAEADAGLNVAVSLFQVLNGLWRNRFSEVAVEGIELEIDALAQVQRLRLEDVQFDRMPLRPGQALELRCVLSRFRGDPLIREMTIEMPADLPAGNELVLAVGNPDRVDQLLGRPWSQRLESAADLASLVRVLADRRSANRLTAVVFDPRRAVISRGATYGELPPTAERLLSSQAPLTGAPRRRVVSQLGGSELELEGPVEGGLVFRLQLDHSQAGPLPPPVQGAPPESAPEEPH